MFDDCPIRTPFTRSDLPDGRVLWIKDEGAQPSGSFKLRGPTNFLSQNDIPSGVVTTASTGNHAIGLSMAARAQDLRAVIHIPLTTPAKKRDAMVAAGAEPVLVDGDYEAALATAERYAQDTGANLVPSYDHPDIIAGNRGVFQEILTEIDPRDTPVYVPIGGGGLLSGAITELSAQGIAVRGVELTPYKRVQRIVWDKAGDLPPMSEPPAPSTEGVAIRTLGKLPAEIMRQAQDVQFTSADVPALKDACRWLWKTHGIRAELGGCLALAAALRDIPKGGAGIVVISGSNVDPSVHAQIVAS